MSAERLQVGMKVLSPYPTEGEGVITAIDDPLMGYVRIWIDYPDGPADASYGIETVKIYRRAYLQKDE